MLPGEVSGRPALVPEAACVSEFSTGLGTLGWLCSGRLSLGGLFQEAGGSVSVGGAHRQSAQSCLGETLSALSHSTKPLESGPAAQLSFAGWGRLTPWFYLSPSLSMPPLLES